MWPGAPYFIILLSLTPDDFTCQGGKCYPSLILIFSQLNNNKIKTVFNGTISKAPIRKIFSGLVLPLRVNGTQWLK
jgi:hypothetical protein